MPKENRTARKQKRKRTLVKNSTSALEVRESLKSLLENNRYSPFQRKSFRSETKMEKQSVKVTPVAGYNTKNIIGNGIKYIMLPLHLLHICIFGPGSPAIDSGDKQKGPLQEVLNEEAKIQKPEDQECEKDKKNEKTKTPLKSERPLTPVKSSKEPSKTSDRKESKEKKIERKKSPLPTKADRQKETIRRDSEDSTDDLVTANEDSDYSSDHWYSANSDTNMNMSIDGFEEDIEKSRMHSVLEEPMDISMEEQYLEKTLSGLKSPPKRRLLDSFKDDCKNSSLAIPLQRQENKKSSHCSMDEEIAQIFQKQCTSSDEEYQPRISKRASERSRDNDRRYCVECKKSVCSPRKATKKERGDNDNEKKKTAVDFVIHKKSKTTCEADKVNNRKSEGERHESSQNTPSKRRSRFSTTPIKNKESKHLELKYKEKGTQTDSAFSDEDVEMIPIEGKLEKKSCGRLLFRKSCASFYQDEEMDQDLEYVADNEDSSDGSQRFARRRVFSDSASSSSTDLGFDERTCVTPERDRRYLNSKSWLNSADVTHRMALTRAPPGFPKLPQNPPLTSRNYVDSLLPATSGNNVQDHLMFQPVAPAPTPMRHLYYDYPEFMDLPENVNRSKILRNILRDNYNQ